jgi:hypothetical protein
MTQIISHLAVIAFFSGAGLYCLWQYYKGWRLKKHGITTNAKITLKQITATSKSRTAYRNYFIEYEFVANDQEFSKKYQTFNKHEFENYQQGAEIKVIYDPKNPQNCCIESKLPTQNMVMILFFAGCCYIAFGNSFIFSALFK